MQDFVRFISGAEVYEHDFQLTWQLTGNSTKTVTCFYCCLASVLCIFLW